MASISGMITEVALDIASRSYGEVYAFPKVHPKFGPAGMVIEGIVSCQMFHSLEHPAKDLVDFSGALFGVVEY